MAYYQYTTDIKADVLFRLGEAVSGVSNWDSKVKDYINRAYQMIWTGGRELDPDINENWHWLKTARGILTLEPPVTTGTVAVTNNSASITFSSGPASSVVGWFFKIDDHPDVFRILTHTGGQTGATLDSVYTGDTDAIGSFRLFKLEYNLASDIINLFSPMRVYQDNRHKIEGSSLKEMEDRWPLGDVLSGIPTKFAFVDSDTVRFNRYGNLDVGEYVRIDYDYMQAPSDLTFGENEEPLIPRWYRSILSDWALYLAFMDKNDPRADANGVSARATLKAMAKENRAGLFKTTGAFGKIFPRMDDFSLDEAPLRTEAGLIIG
jgi:hypothetical protein